MFFLSDSVHLPTTQFYVLFSLSKNKKYKNPNKQKLMKKIPSENEKSKQTSERPMTQKMPKQSKMKQSPKNQ